MSIVYKINGKRVTKKQFSARKGVGLKRGEVPMGTVAYSGSNPLVSEGMGCMKAQVPEMRKTIRKHNIKGVRVRDNGQLEITSRQGRKELLRVRGLCDAEAGFGDSPRSIVSEIKYHLELVDLNNGIYFIQIESEFGKIVKNLIVE